MTVFLLVGKKDRQQQEQRLVVGSLYIPTLRKKREGWGTRSGWLVEVRTGNGKDNGNGKYKDNGKCKCNGNGNGKYNGDGKCKKRGRRWMRLPGWCESTCLRGVGYGSVPPT